MNIKFQCRVHMWFMNKMSPEKVRTKIISNQIDDHSSIGALDYIPEIKKNILCVD